MKLEDIKRVKEIKAKLAAYEEHKNDPYAYAEGEIREVRELRSKAPEYIKFLLQLIPKA
ncbi:MAG: hypothetical protein Q7S36_03310 [Candidatus Liptonbacteria bacterium]|nr:hypothetical protein [Candidatus Liptonbacteria bacterium]